MEARRAAPLLATLSISHGTVQIHASLTRVRLCLAGDDERLEGSLLRGQEPDEFIFQRLDKITQSFDISTRDEVCCESVYVGAASGEPRDI